MNKKGMGLNQLYPAILLLVILGLVVGIGVYILGETSDAISSTEITVTNESGINATGGATVSRADDCGFSNFAVTEANNGTDTIHSGNYTVDEDLGTITNASSEFQSALWNVTYTYRGATDTSSTGYCGVLETSETGVGGFADWVAVLVVIIAAGIVLGIVLSAFLRKNSSV